MHLYLSTFQVIVGQTIGAITFSLVAGQPLVVVMTTAPLALFIKTIYTIAEDFEIDFLAFYGAIGLWNTFFLTIYSAFNMSVLMKFSSRSTEEIFSNFITIAFIPFLCGSSAALPLLSPTSPQAPEAARLWLLLHYYHHTLL